MNAITRKTAFALDRRQFIAGTAAALMMPVTFTASSRTSSAATADGTYVGAYIRIGTDNVVTLITGQTEMGQGIGSGLAQLVAEELMLNWEQMRFEHAPVDPATYGIPAFRFMQLTGGSTSMRYMYKPVREAAAKALDVLRQAAIKAHGGTASEWQLVTGGNLQKGSDVYSFASLLPSTVGLTPTSSTPRGGKRIVGSSVRRLDLKAKVDGSAKFGMDVMLDGMVFASVIHCPTITGTVKSCPTSATGALKVVNLGNAVGVVATNTWSAMRIASSLQSKITWTLPTNLAALDSTALDALAKTMMNDPAPVGLNPREATTTKPTVGTFEAVYKTPFLAHACMEVLNCTVQIYKDSLGAITGVELWLPTQGQSFVRGTVKSVPALSALPDSKITVNSMLCGGGFGRKIEMDYVLQAVKIAVAIDKPVKLTWSRPQDFKNDKYRPCALMRVRFGADGNSIQSLEYRNISASIAVQHGGTPEDTGAVAGAVGLPYGIPNRLIEFAPLPTNVPLGYWRSVGESYNTFAIESAIDELALQLKQDPIEYRLHMLGSDQRASDVLKKLKASPNYTAMNATRRGVAFLKGFNSYVALAVEIGLDSTSRIKVTRAHYVIDCGVVINPNSVEAQMQGGLVHGIYSALYNRVTFVKGVPQVSNFSNYRVLTGREMPKVTVDIIEGDLNTDFPGGIGEAGVPCVAPAIANAYHRMAGTRVRELPFHPGATMSD